jgi:hypothetical protein
MTSSGIGCHFRHNPCAQMIVTVNMFLKLLGQTHIPGLLCTYVNVAGGRKNCDNMPFTWNWMIDFGFIPRRTSLFLHKGWHLACFLSTLYHQVTCEDISVHPVSISIKTSMWTCRCMCWIWAMTDTPWTCSTLFNCPAQGAVRPPGGHTRSVHTHTHTHLNILIEPLSRQVS